MVKGIREKNMESDKILVSIKDLSVSFRGSGTFTPVLTRVNLDLFTNQSMAVIGESGCGKSVLAHCLLRVIDDIADIKGQIRFKASDLFTMNEAQLQRIRGRHISLVPQSAATAFNPVEKIGKQICEFIKKTGIPPGSSCRDRALHFLSKAAFKTPEDIFNAYPHRLSGGMRERALIALAISSEPELLIADEPTKGLDPDAAQTISNLLKTVARSAAALIITHDLDAAMIYDRVAVMYAGRIVETGEAGDVFSSPCHPYTKGLINAMPQNGFKPIPGIRGPGNGEKSGCAFKNRCDRGTETCLSAPGLEPVSKNRKVRCHYAGV